jgi:hypothetical protein
MGFSSTLFNSIAKLRRYVHFCRLVLPISSARPLDEVSENSQPNNTCLDYSLSGS